MILRLCPALLLLAPVLPPAVSQEPATPEVDFVRDVLPVLREHCFGCHGEKKQKGQLRLDARSVALRGGVSGAAILPGKGARSLLVKLLLEEDEEVRMPQNAPRLPKEKVDLIRAWIDQGARWPDSASVEVNVQKHWAYEPPVRREPPRVKNAAWVRNPIDAFVAAEHERRGLAPRPEAPRHVLLRRLSLDLIGLPPTPEEVRAFAADPATGAYEKVVDRLLADPRYGERWGRHWMDVWRYSDWYGYGNEIRHSQRHIWRWRDWIVESLNADKGYDRMVIEMLAGDELAPDDPATLRATGFLARNWFKFNRHVWLQEVVEHTSKAFLATTMNCARCHSHFFDPISHEEYYRFRAFFEPHNVRTDHVPGEPDLLKDGLPRVFDADPAAPTHLFLRGDEKNPDTSRPLSPGVPRVMGGPPLRIEPVALPPSAVSPEKRPFVVADQLAAAEKAIEAGRTRAAAAREKARKAAEGLEGKPDEELEKPWQALDAAQDELAHAEIDASIAEAKRSALAAAVRAEQIEDAGWKGSEAWKKAADAAAAAQRRQALLEASKNRRTAGRALEKAEAARKPAGEIDAARKKLADAEKAAAKLEKDPPAYVPRKAAAYPSTSTGRRLALARWIASPENPLTARVAANHLWTRHFGKPLVGTVFDFGSHGRKPTHPELLDWLATELMRANWAMKPIHRLIVTSSAYRMDSAPDRASLAADPDNQALWRMNPRRMEAEAVRDSVLHVAGDLDPARGGPELDHGAGLTTSRRSLYYRHAQEKQMPFLSLFDAANVTECYERTESIVPQQALALANSSLVLEKSRRVAAKIEGDDGAFVAAAFERILGRPPRPEEAAECAAFLADQARLLSDPARLTGFVPVTGQVGYDPRLRARESLVHVLFNHHDFVTIR